MPCDDNPGGDLAVNPGEIVQEPAELACSYCGPAGTCSFTSLCVRASHCSQPVHPTWLHEHRNDFHLVHANVLYCGCSTMSNASLLLGPVSALVNSTMEQKWKN